MLLARLSQLRAKINPKVIYTFLSAAIIITGTYLAIQYAKGNYRLTKKGFAPETGLLSANSFPPGAQVLIDDKLVTATDDTIYLEPGEYQLKIIKNGYSPWQKTVRIQEELVTQTNAELFRRTPSLTPLTFSGVTNLSISPDGQKIIFYTDSASPASKNGLYILELNNNNLLPLEKEPRQIAADDESFNLTNANFIWSPNSSEIMLLTDSHQVLLDPGKDNKLAELPDIRFNRKQILAEWEEEMYIRERQFLAEFPNDIIKIATTSAKNVYFSPDKKRLLYTATASAQIPSALIPPLPASNTQPETRQLEPGGIYVYDREEDKNFQIGTEADYAEQPPEKPQDQPSVPVAEPTITQLLTKQLLVKDLHREKALELEASPSAFLQLQAQTTAQTARNFNTYHTSLLINTLQWFPDSKHLIFVDEQTLKIIEYDGTNLTTLYAGPFVDRFVYPWPDGTKIVILTSFSPETPKNFYAVEIK
ncbi:MAG: PEGA domain-containing protein [Candidatus Pacebacteria bacterium]|nr:PEGA domain-containing protein [Candidatus Paceibacterota bacterium]